MKKIIALLLALCMVFALCACGAKEQEQASEGPQANVNPTYINWGTLRNEQRSSDAWYADGHVGGDFIYFGYGDSSSGCVFYHEQDGALVAEIPCKLTEELHFVSDNEDAELDILFYDEFSAFDCINQKWYVRANGESMKAYVTDKTFVEANDSSNTITFNADGSALELLGEDEFPGTWKILNATTLRFDDGEYYFDFEFAYNDDGSFKCLDEWNQRQFYPAE